MVGLLVGLWFQIIFLILQSLAYGATNNGIYQIRNRDDIHIYRERDSPFSEYVRLQTNPLKLVMFGGTFECRKYVLLNVN